MSTLLGVLQLVGKGGGELFVFDDALVRASTGVGAAIMNALSSDSRAAGESVLKALAGDLSNYSAMTPEQIEAEQPSNHLVLLRNVLSATLTKGRWPSTAQRTLVLTSPTGATLEFHWPGNGATRPLNHDDYAVALLSKAFPRLLVRL